MVDDLNLKTPTVLSDLSDQLQKSDSSIKEAGEYLEGLISEAEERVNERKKYWCREVQNLEHELRRCYHTEDANCSYLENNLKHANDNLDQCEWCLRALEAAISDYRSVIGRADSRIGDLLPSALNYLCEMEETIGELLSLKVIASSSTQNSQAQRIGMFTTIEFQGRRVYQRSDVDFEYIDSDMGWTNYQRMMRGKPPIGADGEPVELHHVLGEEPGPLAEVLASSHRKGKKRLHGLIGKGCSFRNEPGLENRFNNFRKKYWQSRVLKSSYEGEG